jgi:hypothetical protein
MEDSVAMDLKSVICLGDMDSQMVTFLYFKLQKIQLTYIFHLQLG